MEDEIKGKILEAIKDNASEVFVNNGSKQVVVNYVDVFSLTDDIMKIIQEPKAD